MKKNPFKFLLALGAAICVWFLLDTTGGRLAQPERQSPAQDKFIGFQLVYEEMPTAIDMSDPSWEEQAAQIEPEDRSHWTEYGSETLNVDGLGSVSFPREILIGQYDEEEKRYVFPGKEGLNCFLARRTAESGDSYLSAGSDVADVHIGVGGEEEYIEGTAYFGPPLDDRNWNTENFDYCWTAYRVYQMEDGTVYLDGTGNSYGGVGGFGVSERMEYTTTVNGEIQTKAFRAKFSLESVERVTKVVVKWFGNKDQLLLKRDLAPEEIADGLTLEVPEGALWTLVEEHSRSGSVERSVYTLGEGKEVSHRLVLLDEQGLGRVVPLILEEEESK